MRRIVRLIVFGMVVMVTAIPSGTSNAAITLSANNTEDINNSSGSDGTSKALTESTEPGVTHTGQPHHSGWPHAGEHSPVGKEIQVKRCGDINGICVRVGERRWIQPEVTPGRSVGPVVLCVWYPHGKHSGGWDDPNGTFAVHVLIEGHLYVVMCYYEGSGVTVSGYPRIISYTPGKNIPGQAVNGWEVAKYAADMLYLEWPVPAIAPSSQQLVGTETWFAVASRLNYPLRSAQAGYTWATVSAQFSHVIWDFGSYGRLICSRDAARQWNPKLSSRQQRSNCTKVFATAPSAGVRLYANVTVVWNIYWASSEHRGWRFFDDYRLTRRRVPLNIVSLESVIR